VNEMSKLGNVFAEAVANLNDGEADTDQNWARRAASSFICENADAILAALRAQEERDAALTKDAHMDAYQYGEVDAAPDPRDATISALRAVVEKAREALEPVAKMSECGPLYICTERGQFALAIKADVPRRARKALAAIDAAVKV
jgi:phage gp29-like protein